MNIFSKFSVIHLVLALPLSWAFSHLPLADFNALPKIKQLFRTELNSVTLDRSETEGNFTIHRIAENEKSRYEIFKISSSGKIEHRLLIPSSESLSQTATQSSGYLTHPEDGSFFIYYPRLGSKVQVYDKDGNFLWEKSESRYLHSFPKGKWILAVSGDHSRAFITNPNLEEKYSIEGHMMVDFALDSGKNNRIQMCAAFLDGDLVFFDFQEKQILRKSTNAILKSLDCNFETEKFIAQFETKTELNSASDGKISRFADTIGYSGAIRDNSLSPSWNFEIILPESYPVSLPLVWHKRGFGLVLFPVENKGKVWLFDESENIREFEIKSQSVNTENIENWRALNSTNCTGLWNDESLILFDPSGIIFEMYNSVNERIFQFDNLIILQTKSSVTSLKIEL